VAESSAAGATGGAREETLQLTGFQTGLALSSLQIGSSALTDTATGAVSVIPNPSRRFPDHGIEALYVYYEGYNLKPDSEQYQVRAAIVRTGSGRPDTVVKTPPVRKKKHGTSVGYALGVSVDGVAPGAYALVLELTDLASGQSARAEQQFRLGTPEVQPQGVAAAFDSLSPLERKYYEQIHYVATPRQVAYYKALSDSGKQAYLAKFWGQHNLTEFSRRMETAAERFRLPKVSGINTDRGKVYVKYGEPDAIEQKVIETETRPREYWHYYGSGYVFIFIDLRGDASYRLAWTSAKDEPRTGLEHYLTPEEEEQFR
jgi:GWxTD domain-containing protein